MHFGLILVYQKPILIDANGRSDKMFMFVFEANTTVWESCSTLWKNQAGVLIRQVVTAMIKLAPWTGEQSSLLLI